MILNMMALTKVLIYFHCRPKHLTQPRQENDVLQRNQPHPKRKRSRKASDLFNAIVNGGTTETSEEYVELSQIADAEKLEELDTPVTYRHSIQHIMFQLQM